MGPTSPSCTPHTDGGPWLCPTPHVLLSGSRASTCQTSSRSRVQRTNSMAVLGMATAPPASPLGPRWLGTSHGASGEVRAAGWEEQGGQAQGCHVLGSQVLLTSLKAPSLQRLLGTAGHFPVVWSGRATGSWDKLGPKSCLSSEEAWPAPSPSTHMPTMPLPLTTSTTSLFPKSHFPPPHLAPAPKPWPPHPSRHPPPGWLTTGLSPLALL